MLALWNEFAPTLLDGLRDTLYMTGLATLFAYMAGMPLGILLVATDKGGIAENRFINSLFGWVINIGRSIPFVVLMLAVIPVTRLIAGKIIGPTAAVVPLFIAAAPFVARLVESSLAEVDSGVIEAARCMGATNRQIVSKVLLGESTPSLVRGLSITTITLIGYSAMAGALGAGGLGDIAVRYGLHRGRTDVMILTVLLLIVVVCVIQLFFDLLSAGIDRRNR